MSGIFSHPPPKVKVLSVANLVRTLLLKLTSFSENFQTFPANMLSTQLFNTMGTLF